MRFNKMESKFSKSSLSAPLYFSAFSLLFFTCLFFLASVVLIPISIAKHHIYSHSLCMVNMDVFVCMFYYVQCIYMANLFLFLIVFFLYRIAYIYIYNNFPTWLLLFSRFVLLHGSIRCLYQFLMALYVSLYALNDFSCIIS